MSKHTNLNCLSSYSLFSSYSLHAFLSFILLKYFVRQFRIWNWKNQSQLLHFFAGMHIRGVEIELQILKSSVSLICSHIKWCECRFCMQCSHIVNSVLCKEPLKRLSNARNVRKNYIISRNLHTEQKRIVICKRKKNIRKYNRITAWRDKKRSMCHFSYFHLRENARKKMVHLIVFGMHWFSVTRLIFSLLKMPLVNTPADV